MTKKLTPPFWEFDPEGGLSLGTLRALADYSAKLKNQKINEPMKLNAYAIPGITRELSSEADNSEERRMDNTDKESAEVAQGRETSETHL